ncbi:hypothetical protein Glove_567g30 [Diversispora epigaea]|uniref:Uncharacterized protein n=1 Tax=Diversispora epigaea TaxID=1348612 RepID=A0A397G9S4_9GLOM|nr:hypothetical protein Glove_567g30 [Diversispora epigaea]
MKEITISSSSFVERVVIEIYVYLWFLQRIWITDKFEHLEWKRLKNLEIKSIITLLLMIIMPIQLTFDIIYTILKYQEGFVLVEGDHYYTDLEERYNYENNFILAEKPYKYWSDKNIVIKNISEYLLSINFSFQTGTLFLIQLFWGHLANQWDGKPFMVSLEFKIYIAWGLLSVILFPLSRGLSKEPYSEVVPQMLFSFELIIIFLLGLRNSRKFLSLLKIFQRQEFLNKETILRIRYFHEMNMLLSAGAMLMSVPFLLIGIETFITDNLNTLKFWNDFFMIHFNLGGLMVLVIMILIIYPRYYITGLYGSKVLSENSLNRISRVTIDEMSDVIIGDERENINGKSIYGTIRTYRTSSYRTSSYRDSTRNSYRNSYRNSSGESKGYRNSSGESKGSRNSYRRNSYLNVVRRNRSYRKSRDSRDSSSTEDLITKSITELLKEQRKQIETFRHNLNQKWPTSTNMNFNFEIKDYHVIDNMNNEEIEEESSGDRISQLPFLRRPSLPTTLVSYSLPPPLTTRRPSLPTDLVSYTFPSPSTMRTRRRFWKFS